MKNVRTSQPVKQSWRFYVKFRLNHGVEYEPKLIICIATVARRDAVDLTALSYQGAVAEGT